MNHAITVGGLLLALGGVAGGIAVFFGGLMLAAASMSDAGDDGTGGKGCAVMAGGALLIAGCLMALVI